jgi:hypothetical protein
VTLCPPINGSIPQINGSAKVLYQWNLPLALATALAEPRAFSSMGRQRVPIFHRSRKSRFKPAFDRDHGAYLEQSSSPALKTAAKSDRLEHRHNHHHAYPTIGAAFAGNEALQVRMRANGEKAHTCTKIVTLKAPLAPATRSAIAPCITWSTGWERVTFRLAYT